MNMKTSFPGYCWLISLLIVHCECITSFPSAQAQSNVPEQAATDRAPQMFVESSGNDAIARLSKDGFHFEALSRFLAIPEKEASVAEKLDAAKSAWALGLVSKAGELFDEVLSDQDLLLPDLERARTFLSQAILELQESNGKHAQHLAEQALLLATDSELRFQLYLVIGEALSSRTLLLQAADAYQKAIAEASAEPKNEASFLLGECQMKLGKFDNARATFVTVETQSRYAGQALRELTEIDFQQHQYEGVLTWISEGRKKHPDEFDGPWVSYAFIVSKLELGKLAEAKEELTKAITKHSKKSFWIALAEAAVEVKLAHEMCAEVHRQKRSISGT